MRYRHLCGVENNGIFAVNTLATCATKPSVALVLTMNDKRGESTSAASIQMDKWLYLGKIVEY